MRLRDWPATERPREKLLARGPAVLSDAELLAIFLGSGLRGQQLAPACWPRRWSWATAIWPPRWNAARR